MPPNYPDADSAPIASPPISPLECIECGSPSGPMREVGSDCPGWICEKCYRELQRQELPPLTTRNDPQQMQTRDLVSRVMTIRAGSVDEKNRSVEVVMATDSPVTVFDWSRCECIDEVLVADGGEFPSTMPLLANHMRYSLDDVLGSTREPRQQGSQWIGRAYFAEGDQDADKAWNKVRQGHLTDVSIGYRALDFDDIPPGETRELNGKNYTAGTRTLRITRRWAAMELSVVPIGADRKAKVREKPALTGRGKIPMNKDLRKFLESIGLRSDATEETATAFLAALGGQNKVRGDAIAAGKMTFEEATRAESASVDEDDEEDDEDDADAEEDEEDDEDDGDDKAKGREKKPMRGKRKKNRSASAPPLTRPEPGDEGRESGMRAERNRVTRIRQLAAEDVPAELVTRAIDGGWTVSQFSRRALAAVREARGDSVRSDNGAPGAIVRDHERDCNTRTLSFAMVIRSGLNLETYCKRHRIAGWENIASQADRYREMSLFDVCREALRIEGRQTPWGRDEMIRASVSTASLSAIFTTNVNAALLQAWEEEPDTTVGWTSETDENDFKQVEAIKTDGSTGLDKLARGQTAKEALISDSVEKYKLARYAKRFSIDEQDIIDDRFGALMDMPREFGQGARRLRPDLVYALILKNPTLNETGGALFNNTAIETAGGHANLQAGALSADTLQSTITAMGKQYLGAIKTKNKKPLNIRPEVMIVPGELEWTARIITSSAERIIAANSNGTFNPLQGMLKVVVENRVGPIGVVDPRTGTSYTGTATNYFLASRPGRTIRVAYRKGTNRGPALRSFILDKGQWGIGWDVNLDIEAAAMDFRGLQKSTGA